jgi:hypothetical protein
VYDRNVNGKELNFEASGGLLDASLVMRDRETDSWWSIMTSDSIGGDLKSTELVEMPVGEKMQWKDWVALHPDTTVLSVEGREHVVNNVYDNYMASTDTFRGQKLTDERLTAKEPIYSFHHAGSAFAVPHEGFEGGRLYESDDLAGQYLLVYREPGISFFASSEAFLINPRVYSNEAAVDELLAKARADAPGTTRVGGFDTFWYNWVAVNKKSKLLR